MDDLDISEQLEAAKRDKLEKNKRMANRWLGIELTSYLEHGLVITVYVDISKGMFEDVDLSKVKFDFSEPLSEEDLDFSLYNLDSLADALYEGIQDKYSNRAVRMEFHILESGTFFIKHYGVN